MNRQKLLTAPAAFIISVAGCASNSEQTVDDNTTNNTETGGTATTSRLTSTTDNPSETTESGTETETETETQTATGAADINIKSKELVVDEGEYSTEKYVAADVVNDGEAPSGPIKLTAEWYDADGNYLDNANAFLQTLGGGETWTARVYTLVDQEKIDDFEPKGGFTEEPPNFSPDGLSLASSELKVGENEAVVTGTVENSVLRRCPRRSQAGDRGCFWGLYRDPIRSVPLLARGLRRTCSSSSI